MSSGTVTDDRGTMKWFDDDGRLHRSHDLPAVVDAGGYQYWFQHEDLHRDGDLPAVVCPDGHQQWWVDGCPQSNLDREQTRAVMAQAARWSPLRAVFVGAATANAVCAGYL